MELWLLTLLIGLVVGLALGLTGAGGSTFAIPLLIFFLHIAPLQAITLSMVAVTMMAAVGVFSAARAGLIEYRAGLIFAAGGILGAPVGVQLAGHLPETQLIVGLAALMALVAVLMWRRAGSVAMAELALAEADGGPLCRLAGDNHLRLSTPCGAALVVCGVVIGTLSGLFGVGGGFAIVPALGYVSQLSIHRAVATSMFVITLVAAVALVTALSSGRSLPLTTTGLFIGGGVVGTLLGRRLAANIGGPALQRAFAVMLLATAGLLLVP